MSFYLLAFDRDSVPRDKDAFLRWWAAESEWNEDHDYSEPEVTTPALQAFYFELVKQFPPMNGPYAVADELSDEPEVSDYCIGTKLVYVAFSWSVAEQAHAVMHRLARKHGVGFWNASDSESSVDYPHEAL